MKEGAPERCKIGYNNRRITLVKGRVMEKKNPKDQWINTFKMHVLSPNAKLNVRQKRIVSLLIVESLSEEQRNTLNDLLHAEYEVVQALKVAGRARFKTRRVEADAKKKRVRRAFELIDCLVMSGVVDGKTLEFSREFDDRTLVGYLKYSFQQDREYMANAQEIGGKVIADRDRELARRKAERLRMIEEGKKRRAALRDALA